MNESYQRDIKDLAKHSTIAFDKENILAISDDHGMSYQSVTRDLLDHLYFELNRLERGDNFNDLQKRIDKLTIWLNIRSAKKRDYFVIDEQTKLSEIAKFVETLPFGEKYNIKYRPDTDHVFTISIDSSKPIVEILKRIINWMDNCQNELK